MTFGRHPLPYPSPCGRVTLSVGVHPVCAPVSKSGGLAGLFRSPGSVHSSDGSSASRPFLRFLLRGTVYQFQALCFGLSTALPVITWVMTPVSAILHSLGIRMRRFLDTWLVQSSSQESLLEVLLPVLHSAVFRFHLPSLSSVRVLRLLLRSFQLSSAECVLRPHTWDLSMVLPI